MSGIFSPKALGIMCGKSNVISSLCIYDFEEISSMSFSITSIWIVIKLLSSKAGIFTLHCFDYVSNSKLEDMIALIKKFY